MARRKDKYDVDPDLIRSLEEEPDDYDYDYDEDEYDEIYGIYFGEGYEA